MSLIKLSYSEYPERKQHWEFEDVTFTNINLIVGKNSSGKTRLMSVISSFAKILNGNRSTPFEACKFEAVLRLNKRQFHYVIEFKDSAVSSEVLKVNGVEKLSRTNDGSGKIYYELEHKKIPFRLPPDAIAAVNRRDEVQHPYLIELHNWANSVLLFLFGKDFGQNNLIGMKDALSILESPNPELFSNPNDLVKVYSSAYTLFGDDLDKAVIKDMKSLGYNLTDIGTINIQEILTFPVTAITMFTVEKELGFRVAQTSMSQGMYRALAIAVNLNAAVFSKSTGLILIDDIAEGLDFDRAVSIIKLIIKKAKAGKFQVLMTTNDRFVMNNVPLEYWSVINRKVGKVSVFNIRNSKDKFDKFKYIGLSNFDFFASEFFK